MLGFRFCKSYFLLIFTSILCLRLRIYLFMDVVLRRKLYPWLAHNNFWGSKFSASFSPFTFLRWTSTFSHSLNSHINSRCLHCINRESRHFSLCFCSSSMCYDRLGNPFALIKYSICNFSIAQHGESVFRLRHWIQNWMLRLADFLSLCASYPTGTYSKPNVSLVRERRESIGTKWKQQRRRRGGKINKW